MILLFHFVIPLHTNILTVRIEKFMI